ncbi:MAG: GH3 auxin-responsive promoter family protein [Myxococcota bacterium]
MFLKGSLYLLGLLSDDALRAGSRAIFGRSWRRFQAATAHPKETQEARLAILVARAQGTAFGKEHGFSEIRGVKDYQARVPIRGYEDFEPWIARMLAGEQQVLIPDPPVFFARSSGTTGTPKSVPVTPVYLAEYRVPRRVWARQVMQAFPGLVRGKILSVHSPRIEGRTDSGVPYGSITVAMSGSPDLPAMRPSRVSLDPAPRRLFLLDDFELKYYFTLRLAAQSDVRLLAAVNPSTLVLLLKKLDEHAEDIARDLVSGEGLHLERVPEPIRSELRRRLRTDRRAADRLLSSKRAHGKVAPLDLWPALAGAVSWKGGSAPFYLGQLAQLLPGISVMDYGLLATEGGMSIPLSPSGAHGVVSVGGHFLEFVPEDEIVSGTAMPALLAHELEVGKRYRILISGSHGLYRYDINDVVECVGKYQETAEIAFVHKGGNMLSITGEKVGERHVVLAFAEVVERTQIPLAGFAVSLDLVDPPRYLFAVEPKAPLKPEDESRILEAADQALMRANLEYEAKRASMRLGPPRLVVLPLGAFEAHRRRRVAAGAPESHVKPPHLFREAKDLMKLAARDE